MTGCRTTRRRLIVSQGRDPGPRAAAHLGTCLRCQAEAARIRAFHRRLRALADQQVGAPRWLADRVLALLDATPARSSRRAAEWLAATGAALIVAAALAIVGRRRLRSSLA